MARITWCGLDFTKEAKDNFMEGSDLILAEPVYTKDTLPPSFRQQMEDPQQVPILPPGPKTELFLSSGNEHKLLVPSVRTRLDVSICYAFNPKKPESFSLPQLGSGNFFIRYIADNEVSCLRAVIVSDPHRAELELDCYERAHFENNFTDSMVSLPFKMFIDKFGAYRNMYRSILGIYGLPAFYDDRTNNLRSSVIPLALGPFGSDESRVIRSLTHLRELDRGCEIEFGNEERVFVCCFTTCFIGDMPQQAELAGCLTYKGNRGCRDCLIKSKHRSNLEYDTIRNGRYHHFTVNACKIAN